MLRKPLKAVLGIFVSLFLVSFTFADVVPIEFADPDGDGTFTIADGTTGIGGLTANPATYGTLGYFVNTGGLLCFGNASGDVSGNPTFDGLFNVRSSGAYSNAVTFSNGDLIDDNAGTTGWGVVGGLGGSGDRDGLAAGIHLLAFRTALGNFGWMEINYDDGGTSGVGDDIILIEQSFIETVSGQAITVGDRGVIPEPTSITLLSLIGLAGFRRRRR